MKPRTVSQHSIHSVSQRSTQLRHNKAPQYVHIHTVAGARVTRKSGAPSETKAASHTGPNADTEAQPVSWTEGGGLMLNAGHWYVRC